MLCETIHADVINGGMRINIAGLLRCRAFVLLGSNLLLPKLCQFAGDTIFEDMRGKNPCLISKILLSILINQGYNMT